MRKTLLLLALFALGIGCSSNAKRKFLYTKPDITVIDNFVGRLLADNDSVIYSNLSLRTKLNHDIYTASSALWPANSVYASHKELAMEPMEKIKDVKLIALYDYNNRFQKGSDMSDSCTFDKGDKQDLISRMNNSTYNYSLIEECDIKFKNPPPVKSPQQFVLIFETANNSRFSDTTIIFNIKP